MTKARVRNSKRLSWALRHGAAEAGIPMDQAGWVEITDVLAALDMTREQLIEAVDNNDKGRLQLDGDRVRACQGHSHENMPVTHDALEASWRLLQPEASLWHGTGRTAISGIARHGIQSGQRTHVHLAPQPDSQVGKRASVDLLLEVSPARLATAGVSIFEAPNGVVLVRHVPTDCIVNVESATAAGAEALHAAQRELGFDTRT